MAREDWDDDEPPVLGEAEEDNQAAERNSSSSRVQAMGEATVMDEMMAIAQRAKEAKRKQQEKEHHSKSFGQGLRKGFFNTSKTKTTKKADVEKKALTKLTRQEHQKAREERLRIVDEKPAKEAATASADSAFVFPEVQDALRSMNQLNPKEWMNERFFEKLSRNPKLAQALQNPAFSQAIAEMQQDPRAAILKYQKDPAVSIMLRDFMEFLGDHFEEMGVAAEASNTSTQQQEKQQQHKKTTPTPAIVDLDETRREAIAKMQCAPEEEAQVQRILQQPELLQALSDEHFMQQLHECQRSPGQLQRLAQDPTLGPKLRLLMQHNLVTFSS